MTTTLTQKDSQPRKEDAATQQIAREAACNWLFRDKSDAVSEDEIQDLTKAILSSIERATDTAWSDGFVAGSNTQLAIHAQPQPSKARKEQAPRAQGSPASGERSETPKCTCEDYDQRGAIRDPDCPLHNEYGEERPQRSEPRGQQQEWAESEGVLWISGEKGFAVDFYAKDIAVAHNAAIEQYKEKAWKYDQLCK